MYVHAAANDMLMIMIASVLFLLHPGITENKAGSLQTSVSIKGEQGAMEETNICVTFSSQMRC